MHYEFMITSQERMHRMVLEWGFVPFFTNGVQGFSIEEHTPAELWFTDEQLALPWDWKGPVITEWDNTYGKFFQGKAGFVSLEWLPDFMNWRRHRYLPASLGTDAQHILDVLRQHESLLSHELKKASGFTLARKKKYDMFGQEDTAANRHNGSTFDRLISEMQMGTYVVIADFEYRISRSGERYGWGVARYCTPEALFGEALTAACEGRTPAQSRQRIINHLSKLFPHAAASQFEKLI